MNRRPKSWDLSASGHDTRIQIFVYICLDPGYAVTCDWVKNVISTDNLDGYIKLRIHVMNIVRKLLYFSVEPTSLAIHNN
jgi:hypothetical protein